MIPVVYSTIEEEVRRHFEAFLSHKDLELIDALSKGYHVCPECNRRFLNDISCPRCGWRRRAQPR